MENYKKVHFVGIGGYGMSALAKIFVQLGYEVSGSDLNESNITKKLKSMGAQIYFEHNFQNVLGADLVVYSTAIPSTNPEILAAREKNIPLWHRSELLAYLINSRHGIAIAGTHGKTTTTAMVSLVLEKGGLDPTAVIGGELSDFDGNARLGKSQYLVAEACESDHSFLRYKPSLAVITNVEADHLEHYGGSFERIIETYEMFLKNLKKGGKTIICGDDPYLERLQKSCADQCITYGLNNNSHYRVTDIAYNREGSTFTVHFGDEKLGEMQLSVPGEHNIYNALAAVAVARELGMNFTDIKEIIKTFKGAKRRYQIVGEVKDITVVDDYAHHPTEIKVTLKAAKLTGDRRVVAVFQPHRYSRTYYLFDDFVTSFKDADIIIITPIYSAGEDPMEGISSEILAQKIMEQENREVLVLEPRDAEEYLLHNSCAGDIIITMGAGDIWKTAYSLADKIEKVRM
ncbi:UDP-N-acetylmuramate--L-alanine ligase [Candidatus Contubernalis alkaliaceticus]|uniref:UDP-N-acetylmuramate--L-alanine ligase n=1 Tax=Candidatus Contubernalis alkaliaceticus TaxID=338645 RepID=UPI001F4C12A6|nr:UDP-N-acetylmuramate--L-alanine ligase [Candidatus Contubernalis alkalaceticus]